MSHGVSTLLFRAATIAAICFSLLSCDARVVPHTTTVSKTQSFELQDSAVIFYNVVDGSELMKHCNHDAHGCALGVGSNVIHIYVGKSTDDAVKSVLEHELEHVVYGPKHTDGT